MNAVTPRSSTFGSSPVTSHLHGSPDRRVTLTQRPADLRIWLSSYCDDLICTRGLFPRQGQSAEGTRALVGREQFARVQRRVPLPYDDDHETRCSVMPWPKNHKARTRERIVEAAAAAFRRRGVSAVRVEDVMAEAGLTHGGFYAHFRSKDDLVREALHWASRETVANLSKPLAEGNEEDRLGAVIDAYLSPLHAAHPEHGCPVAALGSEIARGAGPPRRQLASGVHDRLAWMRQLLSEQQQRSLSNDQLLATIACMVGGIVLARTVGAEEGASVLSACRTFLRQALENHSEPGQLPTGRGPGRRGTKRGTPRGLKRAAKS